MSNEDIIERSKKQVNWWQEQQVRARDYLAHDQSTALCFAVVGLPADPPLYIDAAPLFTFREVEHPPGEVALVRGIKDFTKFGAIGRYMAGVRYELAVYLEESEETAIQEALNLGWAFFASLRIKTNADFLVPAVLDCSWNALAAYSDQSRYAQLLEDAPRARRKAENYPVTNQDIEWTATHLSDFLKHWEHPGFRLAAECFATHNHSGNDRYAITTIWSGIEALFEIEQELRFRLATSIAAFLEERGQARLDLYRKVGKLYGVRSKVVHGAEVKPQVSAQHLNEASSLLAHLLRAIIERGYPSQKMLDEMIFA